MLKLMRRSGQLRRDPMRSTQNSPILRFQRSWHLNVVITLLKTKNLIETGG